MFLIVVICYWENTPWFGRVCIAMLGSTRKMDIGGEMGILQYPRLLRAPLQGFAEDLNSARNAKVVTCASWRCTEDFGLRCFYCGCTV